MPNFARICRTIRARALIQWRVKRYQTPRTKWRRRIVWAVILLAPLILILVLFFSAADILRSVSEASLRADAASSLHEAIEVTLSEGLGYSDLVTVHTNAAGDITALTADSQRINAIARDAAYLAQMGFMRRAEGGVEVPLGAFSGIEALSGFGPPVTFKLLPVGAARCSFRSEFTSAGINQTRHAIYLELTLSITVVLPAGTSEFEERAEVLLSESVLSGKVPEFLLFSDLFGGIS